MKRQQRRLNLVGLWCCDVCVDVACRQCILIGHHAMSSVLQSRASRLQLVRLAWSPDSVKVIDSLLVLWFVSCSACVQSAVSVALDQDDDSVIIDLLGILCLKQ